MSRAFIAYYPGDYQKDTKHLNTLEHGAYFLLLNHCWIHGAIPLTQSARARIAGVSLQQWVYLRANLDPFFDDQGRQKRATIEIEKAEKTRLRQSVAGIRSANKRYGTANHGSNHGYGPGTNHGSTIKNRKNPSTTVYEDTAKGSPAIEPAVKPVLKATPELEAILQRKNWHGPEPQAKNFAASDDLTALIRAKGWVLP